MSMKLIFPSPSLSFTLITVEKITLIAEENYDLLVAADKTQAEMRDILIRKLKIFCKLLDKYNIAVLDHFSYFNNH